MGIFGHRSSSRVCSQSSPSASSLTKKVKSPSSNRYRAVPGASNPDPSSFNIIKVKTVKEYVVVKIKYPDCTNYEGVKIMVWRSDDFNHMISEGLLDPHFSDTVPSCLARFVPTREGWNLAIKFAGML